MVCVVSSLSLVPQALNILNRYHHPSPQAQLEAGRGRVATHHFAAVRVSRPIGPDNANPSEASSGSAVSASQAAPCWPGTMDCAIARSTLQPSAAPPPPSSQLQNLLQNVAAAAAATAAAAVYGSCQPLQAVQALMWRTGPSHWLATASSHLSQLSNGWCWAP
jgi:hypothetical protein